MARYDFDWVDAFTDRPFGGNGCAVVHQGAHLPEAVACAYVRETSLSECTFTGPSEVADIKVRYFLAGCEIPFAGHPTIATVAALRDRGLIDAGRLRLETGAGVVDITLNGPEIEMTQIAPQFGALVDPALVASTVGLPKEAIAAPPQLVSTGLPFVITVLKDHAALEAAMLNLDALKQLNARFESVGPIEPFLVTRTGRVEGDTFSRLLLPPPNPPEDSFTGSATGAMAAYLWHHGLMTKDSFIAEQGHLMGRPGQARVTLVGKPSDIQGVKVAGQGFVLMRGTVDLPDQLSSQSV
ncbi:putative isomerase YddE [Tritonibacter multivorans]|uniref:Putative isomerase YddE n=1 Tax=Tritonibacter multivorans TaxID=928856 RepID=A0A0P1G3J2_9RHOB|nr:PhzF family phenazine biosynthesis protein [Tritonibacter multivorans]MDA7422846.1 PhzF family phenazine biosynthesis protein [Tritonibacter multivorans]CUH76267.1 putative isomerase YddE [Tritonibacter multivorans]SFD61816.1 phenazine biosynthesis protein PhzF family [Tritonibacter multivorans]